MRRLLTSVDREMLSLAVPALGALVAEPLYVLADTAVVGNIGTPELGGLGLATQVIGTVLSISIFLAYGTTSAVSRLLGANKPREAAHQAVQGLWIALGVGIAAAALCFVFAPQLLRLLQASGDVERFGVRYLRISTFGFPPMLLVLAGVGYLRGLKDTRKPLLVAAITAAGNLLLELYLVFRLGYGVGASALSTVIVQWFGAGLYLRWIASSASEHRVGWRPDPATLRHLGRDGVDLFVRTSALRLAFLVAAAVAAHIGTAELGAHEIGFGLFFFLALALDAVAIAAQAMVGTLLGADKVAQARAVGRRLTWWGFSLGLVATVVVLGLRPVLPDLFTNDAEVIAQAGAVLLWLGLMQPVAGVVFALDGILIGAGDMRFLAQAMVASSLVFVALAALVVVSGWGIGALWAAIVVFMAARSVPLVWRLRSGDWAVAGDRRKG